VLLALGLIAALCAAFLLLPVSSQLYIAAISDKYDLLRETESPKIVLVGGSNLAFGIDSRRLATELGYNVVNTGLHGGLGLRFMLRLVKPHLSAGDVVVLVPEYQVVRDPVAGEPLAEALAVFPRGLRYVSPGEVDLRVFLRALQTRFWIAVSFEPDRDREIYSRSKINSYGDVTSHLDAADTYQPTASDLLDIRALPTRASIALMNEFAESCNRMGVRVALSFPPYPRGFLGPETAIGRWRDDFETDLNLAVVSDPADYLYPADYFFDSADHLTGAGREIRTAQLSADLRGFLEMEQGSASSGKE
jgi:hypothetical protein